MTEKLEGKGFESKEEKRWIRPSSRLLETAWQEHQKMRNPREKKKNASVSERRAASRMRALERNVRDPTNPSATMAALFDVSPDSKSALEVSPDVINQCMRKSKTLWQAYICDETKSLGYLPLASLVGTDIWHPLMQYLITNYPTITVAQSFKLLLALSKADLPATRVMYARNAPRRQASLPLIYLDNPDAIPKTYADYIKYSVLNPESKYKGIATSAIPAQVLGPEKAKAARDRRKQLRQTIKTLNEQRLRELPLDRILNEAGLR